MSFQAIPKTELHLHIEGAAPPSFIRGLAAEKKIRLEGIFDAEGGYVFKDFDHFLKVYEAASEVLTGPEEFYRLTRAVLEESASHGVVYTEMFISPSFCGGGDLAAWQDYLAAMQTAATEMAAGAGITMRGIVTCVRHEGPETAKKSALCAAETAGAFVTGFGMGGAEMMYRPGDFAYAFDMAREAGLALTCHAGEWGGPDMVADTVRDLRVTRIGHGINAIRDPDLIKRLGEEGVMLEVCPGSNVVLRAVKSWEAHPIARLRDAGVPVCVSTDDPPFFHTTMTREYDMLAQTFGWDEADFNALNLAAMDHAFCDDTTRARLRKHWETDPA